MSDPLARAGEHPRLAELARTAREDQRLRAFTVDLARWLHGRPREELGALARVVTVVAHRELKDARQLCRDRPLLAVEAAARAAEALWPLLRGPVEPDPPDEDETPDEQPPETVEDASLSLPLPGEPDEDEGSGEGAMGEQAGDGEEGEGPSEDGDGEGDAPQPKPGLGDDPMDVLAALAEMDALADPELDALAERLRERMDPGGNDPATDAAELLAEVGEAAEEAAIAADKAARHLERFLPGVGWSTAPGALEHTLLEQLDGLTELLSRLDELDALADSLGRLEDPTTERGLVEGGREEVVGVTIGGDITTALPSELALLADEETEDLFYQRYIEQRLICLELTGEADEGSAAGDKKGPVIACIDTSGSMEGAPELAAKALVLAVCRRVLPRNRAVHLILFGGEGERQEIRLRRGRGGLEALLGFLVAGFHSGTDFDGPLLRAMELLEDQDPRRADVLVVTDGMGRADKRVVERVNAVRVAMGARVWSVVLGRGNTRGVEPFSDHVLLLDPAAAASATGLLKKL